MQSTTDVVDAAASERAFTGTVTIDQGDERTFERAYGFAHRAHEVPNTPATRFAIASGSKAFTALAVMRLVEEGTIALGDRVRPILGDDLPLIDDGVTVEQLLTHTSGIGDYLDEDADWEPEDYVLKSPVHALAQTEAFLAELDGYPQEFPPGERFKYCNGGFMVLALVAERASGVPYHDLVDREVCQRAGLVETAFLRSDDLPGDAALGYLFADGNRTNVLHLPVRGNGDGGIYTSASDLHRFWRAFTSGGIVAPDQVAAMIQPRNPMPEGTLSCGMGFLVHPTGSSIVVIGGDAGVSFLSSHSPETQTTISVLGNSSNGAWPVIRALNVSPWPAPPPS
jgi:CubicO group peptidase (beta-lactamase class C family)